MEPRTTIVPVLLPNGKEIRIEATLLPCLGGAAHEGVAGQRGEELVERILATGRGGEGRGERLAKLGGPPPGSAR
ncbi:MAG: hypothetical protein JO116_07560, partial [Planctomycetaceae bacterium]|nr:hypothetical protein [Planctomycetaceae bacterium]